MGSPQGPVELAVPAVALSAHVCYTCIRAAGPPAVHVACARTRSYTRVDSDSERTYMYGLIANAYMINQHEFEQLVNVNV